MKKLYLVPIIIMLLVLGTIIVIPKASLGTNVDTDITSDTIWTVEGSPYIITDTIHVNVGSTLTIEEGVSVRFDGFYSLIIDGTLLAIGTQSKEIRFTTNQSSSNPGDWDRIKFSSSSLNSKVEYTSISYSRTGIYIEQSTPVISHNVISNSFRGGIDVYQSSPEIKNNTITNAGMGIKVYHGSPRISGNTISDNANGLDLTDSNAIIENNVIRNNGIAISLNASSPTISNNDISLNNEGIIAQFYSTPTIENNAINANTKTGIWCDMGSDATIVDNTISNNYVGLEVDQSFPTVSRNNLSNNVVGIQVEDSSVFEVTHTSVLGSTLHDFALNTSSIVTTVNATFDSNKVSVDPSSTLIVRNYLDVKVEDEDGAPISGANVLIKDNNNVISEPRTNTLGQLGQILLTDRIYQGSSVATENITNVEVEYTNLTFDNNPRDVDMSTSHVEVFRETSKDGTSIFDGIVTFLVLPIAVLALIILFLLSLSLLSKERKKKQEELARKQRKRKKRKR